MIIRRHFISDNASGIHPKILEAIEQANVGHEVAYGDDSHTARARELFRQHFGDRTEVLFALTGTGANVLALQSVLSSYEAVICAGCSHLNMDECGAPEKFTGCKLLSAVTENGKLNPSTIEPLLRDTAMVHRAQPKVVSIAQGTEWGTVYKPEEIRMLAVFCHERGLLLHVDGARLCNAAAALDLALREITVDCGVDLLSFGGTKNGLMGAEAVLFLKPELAAKAPFYRKQAMQLASKMRFISAQFTALLTDELWLKNAAHANRMASLLASRVKDSVEIVRPVETNAVFARITPNWIEVLQRHYAFAVWDSHESIVRWMTSFDTSEDDVKDFAETISGIAGRDSHDNSPERIRNRDG